MNRLLAVLGLLSCVGIALGLIAAPPRLPLRAAAPFNPPAFGPDLRLSTDPARVGAMAANPFNPLNLVLASVTSNNTVIYATSDGGQNWSPALLPQFDPHWDPVLAFDTTGVTYLADVSADNGCPRVPVVYQSLNGGRTWRFASIAMDTINTRPVVNQVELAVDRWPGSPYFGRVYMAAAMAYTFSCSFGPPSRAMLAYSRDAGNSWSPPYPASDEAHAGARYIAPAVAPDGTVYVVYQDQTCPGCPATNLLTRSTTGGVSWSPSVTVTGQSLVVTGIGMGDDQILLGSNSSTTLSHDDRPLLGVAPNNPAHLYVLWTDGRWESAFTYGGQTGQHADIAFSRSTDGGATWSAPQRVNDDAPGNGKDQFMPAFTVGNDGTLHAAWLDRRDDPDGYAYRAYYSQSTDGGLTWTANQPVADSPGVPAGSLGKRTGLAVNADNTLVLPAWTDSRAGQPQVYTDRGILPPGGSPTPTASPTATPTCVPPHWQLAPSHPPARYAPAGVVASDGNFYAVGGLDDVSSQVITETARYNPAQQAWATLAPAPIPVAGAAAAAANGKVYVAGGDEQGYGMTNTLQIYDIATDAWSLGAPLPTAAGSLLAGSVQVAGKVYILGGMDWPGGLALDTNYVYDIATNTWSLSARLPEARHSAGAATMNGLIYLFGGLSNSGVRDDLLVYNPATDTWTTLPGANTGGYGIGGGLVPYGPGQLLALDGATLSSISGLVATNATHIYDIVAATWRPGPRLTDPRFWAGTGVLASGQPIVYGGLSADNPSYYYTLATTEQLPVEPCVTPTPCSVAFNDVPGGSLFYTYVRCLACHGVVSGYPCGGPGEPCPGSYFRPGALVTRGQVSKMVVNALGFLEPIPADQQTFEDVPPGSTFYPYVERLAGREILAGYPCGGPFEPCVGPFYRPYFRPNSNTTRGQLAKIVAESAGWHEPTAGQMFEDVPSGSTFYSFVERLVSRGIVGGYPCGGVGEPCIDPANRPYYRPNAPATRGQMSKIVANATFPNCSVPDKP